MDLVCMRSPEVATLRWPIAGGFVNAALCVTTRKRPMSHTQHIHTRTQAPVISIVASRAQLMEETQGILHRMCTFQLISVVLLAVRNAVQIEL